MAAHQNGSAETVSLKKPPTPEVEESHVDNRCGYTASCKPELLQKCANAKVYLIILSMCTVIQGFAVNGINNVNISSYERRYLLSSKDSSLVASFYDIAAGITVLFVGYFGGSGHQPRYLGVGVASIAVGTFVMSLAHFGAPSYEPTSGFALVCDPGFNSTVACQSSPDNAFLKNYLYILLLGQALNGFGGTCLYSVGVTYLDQSVSTKVSPLYIGIMAGSSILGPAIGYILGGSLLNIYVDFPASPPEGLTPTDPSWVGAWWLGFIFSAALSTILAALMFLFPKELPGTDAIRAAKISECHNNGTEDLVNTAGFGLSYKDMPRATWYLLKNPTYMCITVVIAIELAIAAGFSTFLPKFIANQFAQTASWAAILTGIMAVPGAALGQLLGGYVCKRMELKMRGILKFTTISSLLVLLSIPVFWARCDDANMAGLLVGYPPEPSAPAELDLSSTCNAGCGCTARLFGPVCADGVQYFSPCYAGCLEAPTTEDGISVYHNCSCPANKAPGEKLLDSTLVTSGACALDCNALYTVFVPFAFLVFFFTFFMGAPLTVATLRVVPEKQRAYAVGLQWVFLRFLGSIPGPIIFGSMIDASCSLWEDNCGVQGSCWVYNNFEMSMRLFVVALVLKVISLVFNVLAHFVYQPPSMPQAAEDEEIMDMSQNVNQNNSNVKSASSTAKIIPDDQ